MLFTCRILSCCSDGALLRVPYAPEVRLVCTGNQSSALWNQLPAEFREAPRVFIFRQLWKTFFVYLKWEPVIFSNNNCTVMEMVSLLSVYRVGILLYLISLHTTFVTFGCKVVYKSAINICGYKLTLVH